MGRLDGKVALISGGARGQGATEAKLLASEGAKVVFGDILDDEGKKTEAEIRELGGEATYYHLDVTVEENWRSVVEQVENKYGKLNVLVNNAAILIGRSIEEMTEEEWDRIMGVNAKGVFLGTKHAIPAMRRAGGGSIVNISGTSGLVAVPAPPRPTPQPRRGTPLHQSHRYSARQRQYQVQLGPPGSGQDGDDPSRAGGPGDVPYTHEPPAHASGRRPAGDRLRSALPGLRRVLLRHRVRAGHRRWPNR